MSRPPQSAVTAAAVRIDAPAAPPLVFEVAWEVCSQVGGIYTVLRSKAPNTVQRWGAGYWLVGPYREASARVELEPMPPDDVVVADACAALERAGARVHTGRWLITGRPKVVLIDVGSARHRFAEMKYFYWKDHGVGAPGADWEFDETVAFGYLAADFLGAVRERTNERPMLAHFHEWQAAAALPIMRQRLLRVPTVFTTHATLVGRSLSAANEDLYGHLSHINGEAVADQHGFGHRFRVERAAAHCADLFTTVSEITGQEAEQFLGRRPDMILPNGLNVERFAAPHEFQNLHWQSKQQIHDFVRGHFFPSYTFDLDKTVYVFTAGRYEYRNKGMDVFIDALAELNRRMMGEAGGTTVVAFIIAPAATRGPNVDALKRQAMFSDLHAACSAIKEEMGRRLFASVSSGRVPGMDDLLDEYALVRLKRMMYAWRQGPQPTIVTHDLHDDANDPILRHLRGRNLFNAPHDRVKVVFIPEFVTPTSPMLGMEYDHFVRGCNLGVFPSYYEPWGYTPMECIVRGIPAITSDLSGFGNYVTAHFPDHEAAGMFVARRRGVEFGTTVGQVVEWMHAVATISVRDRITMRNRVESHAEHFDWRNLSRHYRAARVAAFEKHYPNFRLPEFNTLA